MSAVDETLNAQLLRMLVRFFRPGNEVAFASGSIRLAEDLEYLRIQWALSRNVEELGRYLLERRHEAQASLDMVLRDGSGAVKGRLMPARTVMRRRLSGDATQVSYLEPRRNFSAGPNHVLCWVLRYSYHILQRHLQLLEGSPEYTERARRLLAWLGAIRHLKGIGDAVSNTNIRERPSIKSLTQAGESRRRLYRMAYDAYQALSRIEAGSAEHITGLLSGSLIGPLENWRKFELLVAFKLGEALAKAVGEELVLLPIQPGAEKPIASFGRFDVYWQSRTSLQRFPELEPSEVIVNNILRSYGILAGSDRPDVVICDRTSRVVVAIAEAKFSMDVESWRDAFREAAMQLVRYSRLYTNTVPQDVLLRRSIIAVSNLSDEIRLRDLPADSPIAVGIDDLVQGKLGPWTDRVIASCVAAP